MQVFNGECVRTCPCFTSALTKKPDASTPYSTTLLVREYRYVITSILPMNSMKSYHIPNCLPLYCVRVCLCINLSVSCSVVILFIPSNKNDSSLHIKMVNWVGEHQVETVSIRTERGVWGKGSEGPGQWGARSLRRREWKRCIKRGRGGPTMCNAAQENLLLQQ